MRLLFRLSSPQNDAGLELMYSVHYSAGAETEQRANINLGDNSLLEILYVYP